MRARRAPMMSAKRWAAALINYTAPRMGRELGGVRAEEATLTHYRDASGGCHGQNRG